MTFDELPHSTDFYVSTEPHLLDHKWIIATMLDTPWSSHRTHESIVTAIQNSLCFGLYWHSVLPAEKSPRDMQVGIARVLSDLSAYSLISDVIIDPKYRGRGLGKFLVNTIVHHPSVKDTVCVLRTTTAQTLYSRFGFKPVPAMRRVPA